MTPSKVMSHSPVPDVPGLLVFDTHNVVSTGTVGSLSLSLTTVKTALVWRRDYSLLK